MTLLPMFSYAYTGDVVVGNLWYHVVTKGKVASVIGPTDRDFEGALVIPSTIEYEGVTCDVTDIGYNAFYSCRNMTSVSIPNSVTSIGQEAFGDCTGLTSVVIPDNVTSIGKGIFTHCTQITTATVGNGLTDLNEYTFKDCINLTKITLSNSITDLKLACLMGCTNLASITLPDNLEYISGLALSGCSKLTSITLPSSVAFIGKQAFEGCSNLSLVIIGEKINTIQYRAFADCVELQDVICLAKNAPQNANQDAFQDSYIEYATLHVPSESISSYQSALPWSGFKNIVEYDPTGIKDTHSNQVIMQAKNGYISVKGISDGTRVAIYDITGKQQATAIVECEKILIPEFLHAGNAIIIKTPNTSLKIIVK